MKLVAIALFPLFACGCTVTTTTTSDHTLIQDVPEEVQAGDCLALNDAPISLPSGATSDYVVTDVDGTDDMDITIIDHSFAGSCDFTDGDGTQTGVASATGSTGSLPSGDYDFQVECNNGGGVPCQFTLTWTATY